MRPWIRKRFWLELSLAVATASLSLLSAVWPTWFEAASGFDPDRGSGSLEWLVVGVLLMTSLVSALAARVEWRRRLEFDAVV